MTPCGCPSAYAVGYAVWHTYAVTCTSCGVALRYAVPDPSGHLCPTCARGSR